MKAIYLFLSLILSLNLNAAVQSNFISGEKIKASEVNGILNFILENSYKKEEVLVTLKANSLNTNSRIYDGINYGSVMAYTSESIQGDSSLITVENQETILVNKDNTTVILTASIYDSHANGVNYYINHHKDGISQSDSLRHYTGLHGGKSTHQRVLARTVIANAGDRIFITTDAGSASQQTIMIRAINFSKLSNLDLP